MKKIMFPIINLLIFLVAFSVFAETNNNPQPSIEQIMKTYKGHNLMQWLEKATSLKKAGKYNKAIEAYNNAIKLCPNDESKGIIYNARSYVYAKLGNEAKWMDDKRMAAKLGNLEAQKQLSILELFDKAYFFHKSGKYQEAIDIYSEIIELDPENPFPYFDRSISYAKLASETQSTSDKDKYLKLVKDDVETAAKFGSKEARDLLNKNTKSYANKNNNIVILSCSIPKINQIFELKVDYDAKTVNGDRAIITDDSIIFSNDDNTMNMDVSRYTGLITIYFVKLSRSETGQCNKVSNQKQF